MNRYIRRVLMLGLPFIVALSLTVSPTYAAPPTRGEWNGYQIPDWSQAQITPGQGYVIVEGVVMWTVPGGYQFGEKGTVTKEVIDWMIIFVDLQELINNPQGAYFAKRVGRFTWYRELNGEEILVAKGSFTFNSNKQLGHLVAKGDGLVAKGIFWLDEISGMCHDGSYVITDES